MSPAPHLRAVLAATAGIVLAAACGSEPQRESTAKLPPAPPAAEQPEQKVEQAPASEAGAPPEPVAEIPEEYRARPEDLAEPLEPRTDREVTPDGREIVTERGPDVGIPKDYPSDVPPYPGATAKMVRTVNVDSVMGSFVSPDPAEEVVDFYRRELVAEGWTLQADSMAGGQHMIVAQKAERRATLLIKPGEETRLTVMVGPARVR